ncbi:hypothetical protein UY3_15059 [Chelonia mydas]|uniref:Uncharacterized protein n=1 Tax=Chelonia mydas TaxID=8469 RepID=M7AT63_CHEMY|nr:hypothetical protein UY3_15059 [Chelonia mydas]
MDVAPAAVQEASVAVKPTKKKQSSPAWAAASSGPETGTSASVVEVPGGALTPPAFFKVRIVIQYWVAASQALGSLWSAPLIRMLKVPSAVLPS